MAQFELLGGVAVTAEDGEPLDVGPAKCQVVLATLALNAPGPVPVSRLVDVLWGQDPPRTALKTLQGYIAARRRVLGPGAIVRTGPAYRLDVAPSAS